MKCLIPHLAHSGLSTQLSRKVMELVSDEMEDKKIDTDFDCEQFHKYIYRNLSRLKEYLEASLQK